MIAAEALAELKALCPTAAIVAEGAQEFIDLPCLKFRLTVESSHAVLC